MSKIELLLLSLSISIWVVFGYIFIIFCYLCNGAFIIGFIDGFKICFELCYDYIDFVFAMSAYDIVIDIVCYLVLSILGCWIELYCIYCNLLFGYGFYYLFSFLLRFNPFLKQLFELRPKFDEVVKEIGPGFNLS